MRAFALLLCAAGWIGLTGSAVLAQPVRLPLTIDYPMLRSLVIGSAFTGPGRTAVLLDEADGCRRVVLSDPRFRFSGGVVRFETKVAIRIGVMLAGNCRLPVQWEGFVVLLQEPRIRSEWRLSFETVDSFVLGSDRQPAVLAGIVWEWVQTDVIRYLEAVSVDLGPPVSEMKAFLAETAPAGSKPLTALLDSLRPEAATATAEALRINVHGELDLPGPTPEAPEERRLTEAEIGEITEGWERWDVYLAFMMTGLSEQPLSEDDQLLLLETLLMLRHEFVAASHARSLHDDFVRRQFVTAWESLSPVFRRHLGDQPSASMLGYLALFSASDAMVALDRIAPALGVEISGRGLLRLGRLLDPERPLSLAYAPGLDHRLREVLGLEEWGRKTPRLRMPKPPPPLDPAAGFLFQWLRLPPAATAWAAAPEKDELGQWLVPASGLEAYTKRVRKLLQDAVETTLQKKELLPTVHETFRHTALATAWQESCFRQFVEKKGRVTYIVSYDGSSVGLMQINIRVWRGIYREEDLRWNVRYNVAAGCEILDLYLQRYAIRKLKQQNLLDKVSPDTLARLAYALYNGGPGEFGKFLARSRKNRFQLSDRLFHEKLQWVRQGRWEQLRVCLVGS